jgi:8-oxo-dGTP pyrophosphatase MutT (NUDIX family)
VVTATDAAGELWIALVRKRSEETWRMPAGYINVHQSNAITPQGLQADAVSLAQVKPVLEQAYLGDVERLGWQAASAAYEQPQMLRKVLKDHGIEYPACCDVSQVENALREVREETGLALGDYQARLLFVEAPTTLAISSGGFNAMTTAPQFVTHLGRFEELPALNPQDTGEISEAAWIRASALQKGPDGRYAAAGSDGKPRAVDAYEAPKIEKSLNVLLDAKLAELSQVFAPPALAGAQGHAAYRSADGVLTSIYQEIKKNPQGAVPANVAWLAQQKLNGDGSVPELLGNEGQERQRALLAAGHYLATAPAPTLLALDDAVGKARAADVPWTAMQPAHITPAQAQPALAVPSSYLPVQELRISGHQAQIGLNA